ncbi:MAG: DUF1841 family protein [Gammaproteobacteria bacterium]|nr:DUF1841 family protein [Gammaproteobacteria bacterium]
MFQSRDEVRQIYLDVWQKMQAQQILEPMQAVIADIIQLHPEYHPFLKKTDEALSKDFIPEDGDTNPFLHMGMHIALREQASTDRPAGFKKIHQRLTGKHGVHDAEHMMMECLAEALWHSQKDNLPFDEQAYMRHLKSL